MINLLEDKKIDDFVEKSIKSKNIELEYIFGKNPGEMQKILTKNKFIKLLEYCNGEYTIVDENSELDIRYQTNNGTSATRCTIKNLSDIKKYLKPISNYKIGELVDIAKELNVNIMKNTKRMTKQDIYDAINLSKY